MTRLYQYLIKTEPVLVLAPVPVPDLATWFVQANEPVRAGTAIVMPGEVVVADGDAEAPAAAVPDVATWFAQPPQPTRRRRASPVPAGILVRTFSPPVPDLATWFVQPSEPIRVRPVAQQRSDFIDPLALTTPAASETITLDKWFVQASEPVRRRIRATETGWIDLGWLAFAATSSAAVVRTRGRRKVRRREYVTLENGVRVKTTPEMAELLRARMAQAVEPESSLPVGKAWEQAVAEYLGEPEPVGPVEIAAVAADEEMRRLAEQRALFETEQINNAIALILLTT